jgi:Cation transporting ATPase, C-terminus
MVLLIFLMDFVTIAIATDHARPSPVPDKSASLSLWLYLKPCKSYLFFTRWQLGRIIGIGAVFGVLSIGEGLGLMYIGLYFFGAGNSSPMAFGAPYGLNLGSLQTFTFCILFYFTLGSLFSARESSWMWTSAPSWQVLLAVGLDAILVFFIAVFGIPPFAISPVYYGWVLVAFGVGLVLMVVNDIAKVAVIRIMDSVAKKRAKAGAKVADTAS